jgi:hypothetical protein
MSSDGPSRPLSVIGTAISRAWRPTPLAVPQIDPALEEMNAVERVAESLKFFALEFEYWLSPGGRLRAWIALNLFLAIVVAVPVGLMFPLVSQALWFILDWSSFATGIAGNIFSVAALLAATSAVAMGTHAAVVAYLNKVRRDAKKGNLPRKRR